MAILKLIGGLIFFYSILFITGCFFTVEMHILNPLAIKDYRIIIFIFNFIFPQFHSPSNRDSR